MALYIGGTAVDATAAEIDVLDGLDRGSIIYGNASSVTTVLDQGNADEVLTSDGTDIAWAAAGGGVSGVTSDGNNITITDGNLVIPTADKGISFTGGTDPDTAGTATANLLDDYEEGTFTIMCEPSTSGLYRNVVQDRGIYTKIGNLVWLQAYWYCADKTNPVGNIYVTGLPFTPAAVEHDSWGVGTCLLTGHEGDYDGKFQLYAVCDSIYGAQMRPKLVTDGGSGAGVVCDTDVDHDWQMYFTVMFQV